MAWSDDAPSMDVSDGSEPSTPEELMETSVSDIRASSVQENTAVRETLTQFLDESVRQRYLTELGDLFLDTNTPSSQ
ncbi:hypothetical protein MOBT1_001747 [Malassezia obtusa]|uniref:Uncharacterized protein n=1 Tax=Malassezia obtusa TaxID=76774 RepID=A0AAF0E4Q3_9BASI|nr:hypothetical protein MOBT1_001747 [Malassezia obtusa]